MKVTGFEVMGLAVTGFAVTGLLLELPTVNDVLSRNVNTDPLFKSVPPKRIS